MTDSSNNYTLTQQKLKMLVLDVLRHDDIEQLPSILRLLNDNTCIGWREFWPQDFASSEVIPVLIELERNGFVSAFRESVTNAELDPLPPGQLTSSDVEEVWFHLTSKGRALWDSWQPPSSR